MNLIDIGYIFSAGFRCYSVEALITFGLRPFSGPFDYLFIDIETVFKLIHGNMSLLLKDTIKYTKSKQQTYTINSINMLNEKHICYMAHDYTNANLIINTNFLDDNLSGNLYDWEKICIFTHHDIHNKDHYEAINRRVERFNKIIEKQSTKTCLFHITRILTIHDIEEYMNNILRLKLNYSINMYAIIIICCDNLEDTHYFKDCVLFIIKKVDSYDKQINQGINTDNNLDYNNELIIMKQYFNFQLVPLNKL